MPKPLDLSGRKFGRLTAVRATKSDKGIRKWVCECECGSQVEVVTNKLTSGHTKSCGCKVLDGSIRRTHGMKGTRVYSIWKELRKRCHNPAFRSYADYGGRGISVCERWHDFSAFYADMGEPPSSKHSIDRIDNDGDYTPENCRWATYREQSRNRRDNRRINFKGHNFCLAEWEEVTGIPQRTLSVRVSRGWSPQETLTTPVGAKR